MSTPEEREDDARQTREQLLEEAVIEREHEEHQQTEASEERARSRDQAEIDEQVQQSDG